MTEQKRIVQIDVLKGIAIILVVLGHCISGVGDQTDYQHNLFFKICYSFHMPLFMLLSGFVCGMKSKDKINKIWIERKFFRLIIPYVIWLIINTIIYNRMNFENYWSWIISSLHIWYLIVLFVSDLSYFISCKTKHIFMMIFYIVSILVYIIIPNEFCKKIILFYPFYVLGIILCINKNIIYKFKNNKMRYCAFILYPLSMIFYAYGTIPAKELACAILPNADPDFFIIKVFQAGIVFYSYYIVPLFGICFVSILVYDITELRNRGGGGTVIAILQKIGVLSMPIYLMHSIFRIYYFDNNLLNTILSFILGIIIPILFYLVTKRFAKLQKILFGM